jgi:hypothetical protein
VNFYNKYGFTGFGIICQTVTLMLPGKNPMLYYICQGKMPVQLLHENFKGNPTVTLIALVPMLQNFFLHHWQQG